MAALSMSVTAEPALAAGAAPARVRTQFGVSVQFTGGEPASAVVARAQRQFGALPVVRVFDDLPEATWRDNALLAALGTGSTVIYSIKGGDMTSIARGALDARLTRFLRTKPAGVTVYVVLHHEPEEEIARGHFTAQQFVRATAHLAPVIRRAGGIPTTVLMAYTLQPGSHRDWRNYYTPAVDMLAWDAYNTADKHDPPAYKDPDLYLQPVLAVARQTGKPFGWAEVGSPCISTDRDCSGRARWLTRLGTAMAGSGATWVSYWNRSSRTGANDFSLHDPASRAAWRRLMNR